MTSFIYIYRIQHNVHLSWYQAYTYCGILLLSTSSQAVSAKDLMTIAVPGIFFLVFIIPRKINRHLKMSFRSNHLISMFPLNQLNYQYQNLQSCIRAPLYRFRWIHMMTTRKLWPLLIIRRFSNLHTGPLFQEKSMSMIWNLSMTTLHFYQQPLIRLSQNTQGNSVMTLMSFL